MPTYDVEFESMLLDAVKPTLAKSASDKVLLLSCVDYRYPKRIIETMDEDYKGRYYHLAMAGGSHAGNKAKHEGAWHKTLFDHLKFAVEAEVGGVVIIDHLDCQAYRLYEDVPESDLGTDKERAKHVEVATAVVAEIVKTYSKLKGKVTVLLLPKETKPEMIASG